MKLIIIGYAAPPKFPYARAFFENINHYKTRNDLILFSEHDWPGVVRLQNDPEIFANKPDLRGERRGWAVHNAIFFTGIKIAKINKATHIIYLDGDCRVGCDYWDEVMVQEYEAVGSPAMAGTMCLFNPAHHDDELLNFWQAMIRGNPRFNFPVATYGIKKGATTSPIILMNGALGLYEMASLEEVFGDLLEQGRVAHLAAECTAWDFELGRRLWGNYRHKMFKKAHHMKCIYSGYLDKVTSEQERRVMLEKGHVVAVHQIRDGWQPHQPNSMEGITPEIEAEVQRLFTKKEPDKPASHGLKESPKVEILIQCPLAHVSWLRYCLRSIDKFVTGVQRVKVVVPIKEKDAFAKEGEMFNDHVVLDTVDEPEGKGHLAQMVAKCRADRYCPDADFVWHIDADFFVFEPMDTLELFEGGKPRMVYMPTETIGAMNKAHLLWKAPTEKALGIPMDVHTMLWNQSLVFPRWFYQEVRRHIEAQHGIPFEAYVYAQKATFPYGFCEFTTLGMLAWHKHKDAFSWFDKSHRSVPYDKIMQWWSHSAPNIPDDRQAIFQGQSGIPGEVMQEMLDLPTTQPKKPAPTKPKRAFQPTKKEEKPFPKQKQVGPHNNPMVSRCKEYQRRHVHQAEIAVITEKILNLFEDKFITPPETSEFIEALITMSDSLQILELGMYSGFTTLHMIRAIIGKPTAKVVSIDCNPAHNTEFFTRPEVEPWFEFINGRTPDCLKQLHGRKFDLVFVDSAHTLQHTEDERVGLLPITDPGSLLLFHDCPKRQTPDAKTEGLIYRWLHDCVKAGYFKGTVLPTGEQLDCLGVWGKNYPKDCNPHLGCFVRL